MKRVDANLLVKILKKEDILSSNKVEEQVDLIRERIIRIVTSSKVEIQPVGIMARKGFVYKLKYKHLPIPRLIPRNEMERLVRNTYIRVFGAIKLSILKQHVIDVLNLVENMAIAEVAKSEDIK